MTQTVSASRELALIDVLDSALNKGVVLWGDAIITLADVDLAYVGIKVLLSSVEAANRMREAAGLPALLTPEGSGAAPTPETLAPLALAGPLVQHPLSQGMGMLAPYVQAAIAPTNQAASTPSSPPSPIDKAATERGLAQLVLTLVELLRQLIERQAVRRVEGGGLNDEQIERLGQTLIGLEARMAELKQLFDFNDDDLNLNLGPLGNLL